MLYAISCPICLECDAVDEQCLMLVHEGQILHQCCECGSNRILWHIEAIEEDEPNAHDLKKMAKDEEDLVAGPNDFICPQCRAKGYGRA